MATTSSCASPEPFRLPHGLHRRPDGAASAGWLDANPQPTEELEKIDPSEFYGKLQSLRAAVQEELEALAPDSSAWVGSLRAPPQAEEAAKIRT